MAITSFVFFICAFRTNVVFVIGLFTLTLAFCFVAALWWLTAIGNMAQAAKVQKVCFAILFTLVPLTIATRWHFLVWLLSDERQTNGCG